MTRRIFNRTANTINDTPPITMADTENSFLLLALFAVLIPTINMIIEGKRIRLRPIRPVSSKIVAKINSL